MITLDAIAKEYHTGHGDVLAVEEVSLEIETGTWTTLLGPSGCGKTTTLRMVAGLESPTNGRIAIDGVEVYSRTSRVDVRPHRRPIGMVFQSYALWPNMTVFQNVAFPLKMMRPRVSREQIRERVERSLELVGLGGFSGRTVPSLSGGQQQRVALARALVREPKVLLLDEPLSNLDAALRQRMCAEMRSLQQQTGVTTLFVTHDQTEAMAMSDQVVLMQGGNVVQSGTPQDLFEQPSNSFAANFMGASNALDGTVATVRESDGYAKVVTSSGAIWCAVEGHIGVGATVRVMFRPDSVSLAAPASDGVASEEALVGRVAGSIYQGTHVHYELLLESGESLNARIAADNTEVPEARHDEAVQITVEPAAVWVFETAPAATVPAK